MKKLVDAYNKKAAALTRQFTTLNDKITKQREVVNLETLKLEKWESELIKLRGKRLSWVDEIMAPLAEELGKYFGTRGMAYGPCGLRSEVSIRVSERPDDWLGTPYKLLVIIPKFDESGNISLFYDTGEVDDTKALPGSLAELNGFHHVVAPLPETIEEMAAVMRDVSHSPIKKLQNFEED